LSSVNGTAQPLWDAWTRLFHWTLMAFVVFQVWSGKWGGPADMDRHMLVGQSILALVLFRVMWGFVGPRPVRFVHFLRGPRTVLSYAGALVRREAPPWPGHNPMGGWSVVVLLLILAAQAGTGLFANDDILAEGPLFDLVGKDMSDTITGWHSRVSDLLFIFIGLHVAAVVLHEITGERLVGAMIHGRKVFDAPIDQFEMKTPGTAPSKMSLAVRALVCLGASALIVWAVVQI